MLPDDYLGAPFGIVARIKIVMLAMVFIMMLAFVMLKVYGGIVVSHLVMEVCVYGGFGLAVVIAFIWHNATGYDE